MDERPGLKPPRRRWSWGLHGMAVVGGALAGGVGGALAGGVAEVASWLHALSIIVGATLTVLAVELQTRRTETAQLKADLRTHVAGAREQLLPVEEVGLEEAGVDPPRTDIPYVPREVQTQAKRALQEHGRVLIVGKAMAGKSRLALQVAQELFAGHAFLKPYDGKALHQLTAKGYTAVRVLVWLDQLDGFLPTDRSTNGLTKDDLNAFCRKDTVVVATIGRDAYDAPLPRDGYKTAKTAGRPTLRWFHEAMVMLNQDWTEGEFQQAKAKVSPQVLEAARGHGLSVYLGAGPKAIDWFRLGESDCREGHAVVRAAADWRRLGRSPAIPREVLVAVLPAYLPSRADDPDAAVKKGLQWATKPWADDPDADDTTGAKALLEETNGGYVVLDYLVEHVTEQGRPIPKPMEKAAERDAAPEELLDVAAQAIGQGREDRAEAAWQRARTHPIAKYNLGMLYERRGELPKAERLWREAAEEGDPGAMYRFGMLLLQRGARRDGDDWIRRSAKAAARPTADKRADVRVHSADARIAFSGAATDAQQRSLTAALRGYMAYLESLDAPLGPVPTVHIEAGHDMSYPDPAEQRLFIGGRLADRLDVVLHEYSHWVLDSLVLATRDAWTDDIMGVESGLAYYLPCSFMNSPRITFVDLRAPSQFPPGLDPSHQAGLRWAGALWEVRGRLGQQALDQPLLNTWRTTSPTEEDGAGFAYRLGQLLDNTIGASARQLVREALVHQQLLKP